MDWKSTGILDKKCLNPHESCLVFSLGIGHLAETLVFSFLNLFLRMLWRRGYLMVVVVINGQGGGVVVVTKGQGGTVVVVASGQGLQIVHAFLGASLFVCSIVNAKLCIQPTFS